MCRIDSIQPLRGRWSVTTPLPGVAVAKGDLTPGSEMQPLRGKKTRYFGRRDV
jgi:hypothetical protein